MLSPRALRTAAALAALTFSLSACVAGQDEGPAPSSDGGGGTAATQPAEESAEQPAEGTLALTVDGEQTTLTPGLVRCGGEPGTIRHAEIAAAEGELPLIEVRPGEFAMVKLQTEGEPEKTTSPEGILAEDDTITFESAQIGDVVVDGTVRCQSEG